MVKFLFEHATTLEEKVEELPDPWLESTLNSVHDSTRLERGRFTQSIITNLQTFDQTW